MDRREPASGLEIRKREVKAISMFLPQLDIWDSKRASRSPERIFFPISLKNSGTFFMVLALAILATGCGGSESSKEPTHTYCFSLSPSYISLATGDSEEVTITDGGCKEPIPAGSSWKIKVGPYLVVTPLSGTGLPGKFTVKVEKEPDPAAYASTEGISYHNISVSFSGPSGILKKQAGPTLVVKLFGKSPVPDRQSVQELGPKLVTYTSGSPILVENGAPSGSAVIKLFNRGQQPLIVGQPTVVQNADAFRIGGFTSTVQPSRSGSITVVCSGSKVGFIGTTVIIPTNSGPPVGISDIICNSKN